MDNIAHLRSNSFRPSKCVSSNGRYILPWYRYIMKALIVIPVRQIPTINMIYYVLVFFYSSCTLLWTFCSTSSISWNVKTHFNIFVVLINNFRYFLFYLNHFPSPNFRPLLLRKASYKNKLNEEEKKVIFKYITWFGSLPRKFLIMTSPSSDAPEIIMIILLQMIIMNMVNTLRMLKMKQI